ncbi:MAG TPA: glutathione S-transferase N-terminal domain-containing protein [Beijerinckiaceae bacterium]|jgi:glutathione S-transferase|nr:glutathione S-transferase N-terminal domain-containing protein [Beijerinckiaceae bacterium]
MKLHHSTGSQFVRKVSATLIELGLDGKVELIKDKKDLEKHNPLLKRPALITDDGDYIIDSPVICAYLDSLAGNKLIPTETRAHWKVQSLEALADGVMDAIGGIRTDRANHPGHESKDWHEKQMLKITQGLDAFEAEAAKGVLTGPVTIAHITVGCLCGYLDFVLKEFNWRDGRPALAVWWAKFSERPSMAKTVPHH